MDDIISDTLQSGESGSPASSPAPAGGDLPSLQSGAVAPIPGDSTGGGDTPQPLEEAVVDPIEAALKDLPAVEQLRAEAERGVQYARALQDLRPIAEQARTQSQTLKTWQPIVDRFSDPTKLESQLELAGQFLKDTEVDGRSIPDTKGAVEWLDANSPTRADSFLVDLLQSKNTYNGVEDTRLNHVCRQIFGRDYNAVVQGLQELETRPANQVVNQAELDAVDPKFHSVWKGLAPETKEWLMDERTSETARNQYLQKELSEQQRTESDKASAERANTERVERETAFFNEARAEASKAVDEGLGTILNSILDSTFKDISNDTVTLTGSKEDDVLVRLFIGGTLTSLTDPNKSPYVANDLKALGITLDPEIYQHEATYEKALIAARIAARYGDKASADARQLEADNAQMWLKAKGNDLASQMIDRLSKILGLTNENRSVRLANANSGRAPIQGNPLPGSGSNGGQQKFTTPLGPERNAEIANRFAR